MRWNFNIYLYLLLLMFLMSCEREIYLPEEDRDQLPVINGFWDADGYLEIWVSETGKLLAVPELGKPFNDFNFTFIADNQPQISGITNLDSGFFSTRLSATSALKFRANITIAQKYFVTFEDDFPKNKPEFNIDTVIKNLDYLNVKATLKDHLESEYYLMDLRLIIQENGDTSLIPIGFSTNEKVFLSNLNTLRNTTNYVLFNDILFNNQFFDFSLKIRLDEPKLIEDVIGVSITVKSLSQAYYQYLADILQANQIYSGPLSNNYNQIGNITNGLGYFAGIKQHSVLRFF
jgi:hypothetical protein